MRLEDLPGRIETDEENERFLAIVEPMMNREKSPEERALFRRLVELIQEYDDRTMPSPDMPPDAVPG